MNEMVSVFSEIVKSDAEFPVDFDAAWNWVGYSRKDHALEALALNFSEGEDFSRIFGKSTGGRRPERYMLTTDCFKAFAMMAGTERGKDVRRYFIEAEKMVRQLIDDLRVSRAIRRELTDSIRDSHLNDAMHGFAYKQFTDLIYRAVLGMSARDFRKASALPSDEPIRARLTAHQTSAVCKLEKLVTSMVDVGADYQKIKDVVSQLGQKAVA